LTDVPASGHVPGVKRHHERGIAMIVGNTLD
jgi:hypothetical protein